MPRLSEVPRRANFSYVSLENVLRPSHARQSNPPSRGTLSSCPRHPSKRAIFLPCKWFVPGFPAGRCEKKAQKWRREITVLGNCFVVITYH